MSRFDFVDRDDYLDFKHEMMTGSEEEEVHCPYVVALNDLGTEVTLSEHETFPDALEAYTAAKAKYTRWHQHVMLYNADRADGGYGDDGTEWDDGLTDDERDEVYG